MNTLRSDSLGELRQDRFRPDLLTLARMSRGMTQKDLAAAADISQSTVSRLEEQATPSDPQLARLATALGYPPSFFFQPDPVYGFGVGELFHRRRKTMSTRALNAVHAEMNVGMMATRRLLKAIDPNPVDLPIVETEGPPAGPCEAARALRARWLVPPGPVKSVAELLDRAGILAIPFESVPPEVDAIGIWPVGLPPLIFFNPRVPQDRLRLTLVHEVAHFVLHSGWGLALGPEIENEANRFAAEFLVPAADAVPQLRQVTLAKLASLKRHWRVSMAALLVRAKELGGITPRRYQALWTEMGKLGYRTKEPTSLDVTGEEPGSTFNEILRLHLEELVYSPEELAQMTHLLPHEFIERFLGGTAGPRPLITAPTPAPRRLAAVR